MRILDLYCGAGGAAMGYHRAFPDAEIIGVDLVRQHEYPFTFILGDADTFPLDGYDLIHASPPCKLFTSLHNLEIGRAPRLFDPHVDHLTPTLTRLDDEPTTWIVENVPGAPMPNAVTLCGSSFGLGVRRHRLFASNVDLGTAPACRHAEQGPVVGVTGHSAQGHEYRRARALGVPVAGEQERRDAMDIHWMTREQLTQAIPPAYTEWIGRQLLALEAAA